MARARSGADGHTALLEQPLHLGPGEVRVEDQAGLLAHERQVAGLVRAQRTGPPCAGPATRGRGAAGRRSSRSQATTVSRWLVTPMDAHHPTGVGQPTGHLAEGVAHGPPDLGGVVLHPARAGEVLGQLPVGDVDHRGPLVDHEGPDAGRAGVDGDGDRVIGDTGGL